MRYLVLVLLAGCSGMSLEDQYFDCLRSGGDCEEIAERLNEQYERKKRLAGCVMIGDTCYIM